MNKEVVTHFTEELSDGLVHIQGKEESLDLNWSLLQTISIPLPNLPTHFDRIRMTESII